MKKIRYSLLLLLLNVIHLAYAGSFEDFFKALEFDDDRTTQELLWKGFDPNTLNEEGIPAISYAMQSDSPKAVEALLKADNLNPNLGDLHGDTPLMIASSLNNTAWISRLIAKGALINRSMQWNALHYAAGSGSLNAIELLIKAGADINILSSNGSTPLMIAARENKESAAMLLLRLGADPRPVNQSEYNAAGYAMRAQNKSLALEIMRVEKEMRQKASSATSTSS